MRQEALSELWESHSKLVVAVARQYHRPYLEITDLIGVGHLGLHAAIEGFDPDRFETRLSTYAVHWIRHYIQDYIRHHAFPVRLPASTAYRRLFDKAGSLFRDARQACHREGISPTDEELCARVGHQVGLSGDEVAQSLSLVRGEALSLDAPADDPDEGPPRAWLAADGVSPEEAAIVRLDHAKLRDRILALAKDILSEREQKVFFARCMSADEQIAHLQSLAEELGVTRERVYQLEANAKRKIAEALVRDRLIDPAFAGTELPKSRASRRSARSIVRARPAPEPAMT